MSQSSSSSGFTSPIKITRDDPQHQNATLLVDDRRQYSIGEKTIAQNIVGNNLRFRVKLTDAEREAQIDKRFKILPQLTLPAFSPHKEEEFENWVDTVAIQVTKLQICVSIFQDAWSAIAPPSLARHIGSIPLVADHEELVSKVARILFKTPQYIRRFEVDMLSPLRQSTVFEARLSVEDKIARYSRLCTRWEHPFHIADVRCNELALQSLPLDLEEDVRSHYDDPDWDSIWKRAEIREERMRSKPSKLNIALPTTHERPTEDQDHQMPQNKRPAGRGQVYQPCGGCGGPHFRKKCPYKEYRCHKCDVIGHIAKVCRNIAIKDHKGRVETRVEPKDSNIVMRQRRDRSQQDKMNTAESAVSALREVAEKRSKKSTERRKKKKEAAGKTTRPRKDHPVGVAREESAQSDSESSDELTEDEGPSDLENALQALNAVDLEDQVVVIAGSVNNHPRVVVADTGASRALCNKEDAATLGLMQTATPQTRLFSGLGNLLGIRQKPATVKLGQLTKPISFWVVDKPGLPLLIGKRNLMDMNVLVDPVTNSLLSRDTFEIVAAGIEVLESQNKEAPELDTITQKKLGATDRELFEEGKNVIMQKLSHLSEDRKEESWSLFKEFEDIWLRPKPGAAVGHKAQFKVSGPPTKQKMRHLTPELEREYRKQTDAMIKAGILEPSKSSWCSVPVFAKKKDGGWRLCLDYRHVNRRMKADRYPLPRLWDLVHKAAHHKWYAVLDVNWGFWSLPLHPDSRECTAILTPDGLMQFTVCPFGIRNSPPEFQRMMDEVVKSIEQCVCYVDDIILYANTYSELLSLLRRVFNRFRKHGIYIKLTKMTLFAPEVQALGFMVGYDGIKPNPMKVQGIRDAKLPRNRKQMRSFLGAVGFLRRFIPNCSEVVGPLNRLMRKGVVYKIDQQCVDAFNYLKELISEHTLLNAPRGEGSFVIVCDASSYGLGAALLQWQDEELVPIEFASKTLNPTEGNWPPYEREAYAIRWSVQRFEDYVRTGHFLVITDHHSLQWMNKASSGKVMRWSLYLQQFDMDIKHINGEHNVLADWLSRSVPDDDPFNDLDVISVPTFLADNVVLPTVDTPITMPSVVPLPTVENIKDAMNELSEADLKYTYKGSDGLHYHIRTHKLFIPPLLRESFIYWFHVTTVGCHAGINRTTRRLLKHAWWPKAKKCVATYINSCLFCIRRAVPSKLLTYSGVLNRPLPFQLISIDFVGPRKWKNESYYYVVIIDHASRFMIARPTDQPPTAEWLIAIMRQFWVAIFGVPTAILCDRGAQFRSKLFRNYCLNILCCLLVHTSAYYPQGNSVNESSHRALDSMLIACLTNYNLSLEDALSLSVSVHNATPHAATGHSPFYMLHGLEPGVAGLQLLNQKEEASNASHLDELLAVRAQELCRANLQSDPQLKVVVKDVKRGDWVVYLLPTYERNVKEDISQKFDNTWSLPAKVTSVKDKVLTVETWADRKTVQIPVSKIRVLQGSVPVSLREVTLRQLDHTAPSKNQVQQFRDISPSTPWSEFLEENRPIAQSSQSTTSRKRTRLS